MVYSEVPNFSEPNTELLAQANKQNKTVSAVFLFMQNGTSVWYHNEYTSFHLFASLN